jgi:hypothetical protein
LVDHRAAAAFLAMLARCFGVSAFARAFPPFNPPIRPNATAAGFFVAFSFCAMTFNVSSFLSQLKTSFTNPSRVFASVTLAIDSGFAAGKVISPYNGKHLLLRYCQRNLEFG